MTDKNIECVDCHETFVFTAAEQAFYKEKGFENEPKRCPACRAIKKQNSRGNDRNYNTGSRY